jgi:hypothetical protein
MTRLSHAAALRLQPVSTEVRFRHREVVTDRGTLREREAPESRKVRSPAPAYGSSETGLTRGAGVRQVTIEAI